MNPASTLLCLSGIRSLPTSVLGGTFSLSGFVPRRSEHWRPISGIYIILAIKYFLLRQVDIYIFLHSQCRMPVPLETKLFYLLPMVNQVSSHSPFRILSHSISLHSWAYISWHILSFSSSSFSSSFFFVIEDRMSSTSPNASFTQNYSGTHILFGAQWLCSFPKWVY